MLKSVASVYMMVATNVCRVGWRCVCWVSVLVLSSILRRTRFVLVGSAWWACHLVGIPTFAPNVL